jgi:cytidyltransferase-like protein
MPKNIRKQIVATGAFDDLRSRGVRILEEASKLGELTVLVWPDAEVQRLTGKPPKFPEAERLYFLNAIRFVGKTKLVDAVVDPDALPRFGDREPDVWAMLATESAPAKQAWCAARGVELKAFSNAELREFPDPFAGQIAPATRKKVLATGSFDWFHSGHVRFFEEVSSYGDLYVAVGQDANIRLLKGEGHPLLSEAERRYMVGSIRYVHQALICSGHGWLDAEPEIQRIKPDIYAVNEDGDRGGKREYCEKKGIEYRVLKRAPAPGLPQRSSTDLRGF